MNGKAILGREKTCQPPWVDLRHKCNKGYESTYIPDEYYIRYKVFFLHTTYKKAGTPNKKVEVYVKNKLWCHTD